MDTIMIEGTVEHFVEGKSITEIARWSEEYVLTTGVLEYRTKFENLAFEKFKSKWADTIELTITQLDRNGATVINQEFPEKRIPMRRVLYPGAQV